MMYLTRPIYRDKEYRRYVASHACFGCNVEGISQCAHEEQGKGKSLKTDDRRSFPLCATVYGRIGCHEQHTLLIDMDRETRRWLEAQYVERMQARAKADGWDIFDEKEAA